MTPQDIIKEIQRLPPADRQMIKDSIDNGSMNGDTKTSTTEREVLEALYAKGVIGNVPHLEAYTDEDDDFEPIDIPGKPTSEIIIEERR